MEMRFLWIALELLLLFALGWCDKVKNKSEYNSGVNIKSDKPKKSNHDKANYIPPDLYFVGVSKGGTTSMIHILNQHPLITGVGNYGKAAGAAESHIMARSSISSIEEIKAEESKRLQYSLTKKNLSTVPEHGVIVHYTPHYIIDPYIGDRIIEISQSANRHPEKVKILVMLREPTSRTISSWWYKSGCYKHDCHPLKAHLPEGMGRVNLIDQCMAAEGPSMDITSQCRTYAQTGKVSKDMENALVKCPLKLLKTNTSSLYGSHFGKSMYAHQLLRWYQRFHHTQVYVLLLENFAMDPTGEMELLFKWLGVPAYGPSGFQSQQALLNVTKTKRNVHAIPADVYANDVIPYKAQIDEFYKSSLADLYYLLLAGNATTGHKKSSGARHRTDSAPLRFPDHEITWTDIMSLVHQVNVHLADGEAASRN